MKRAFTIFSVFLASCFAAVFLGCEGPEIETYKAPKVAHIKTEKDRMLAAIVIPEDDPSRKAWFFKVVDKESLVAPQEEAFRQFITSVKFVTDGHPTWKLPQGWREGESESSMRFATIIIPADEGAENGTKKDDQKGGDRESYEGASARPLDVSVIPLPISDTDLTSYKLDNINRWRRQLDLPPLTETELEENTTELELANAQATLVDFVGEMKSDGMTQPPFASGPFAGGAAPPLGATPPSAVAEGEPPTFEAPESWKETRGTGISTYAYEVVDGDKRVEITVTSALGTTAANVNRWRRQIGLPPLPENELNDTIQSVQTRAGVKADYVELIGKNETILGALVSQSGRTWFVKLKGDATLAESEKERFKNFVKSMNF